MMQSLVEFMASPDWLTPQGMARRYADAAAAGVVIGTPDNPFPGMSPEDIAAMDEFKAELLRERMIEETNAHIPPDYRQTTEKGAAWPTCWTYRYRQE